MFYIYNWKGRANAHLRPFLHVPLLRKTDSNGITPTSKVYGVN